MEENIEKVDGETELGGESGSANPQITDAVTQSDVQVAAEADGGAATAPRHRRQEKVGLVTSDKMQKTVVVRVERQVRHRKYKRYIRRRTKFMAHDEVGAHIGDIVRIVETRPLSARKRWRVVEIVQKAR
jgi:small subunit ribosomal protein S17